MSSDETWGVVGRQCIGVSRVVHQLSGQPPTPGGPIEISWDTGEVTLLDVRSDWTLEVSPQPWVDPYAGRTGHELEIIGNEVGLWTKSPVVSSDELSKLVGSTAIRVTPELNQFAEVVGLDVSFDGHLLSARVHSGYLTTQVTNL